MIRKQMCSNIGNKLIPGGKNSPFIKTKSVPESHPGTAKQQLKLFRSFSIFSCLSPFLPVFCWWCFSLQLDQRERLADTTVAAGAGFATVQEKRGWTEARGGGEGSADLSHARKKGFTSSRRPQAPADYHRDTVGSFSPSAAFCVLDSSPLFVPVNKRSMD